MTFYEKVDWMPGMFWMNIFCIVTIERPLMILHAKIDKVVIKRL